jgi:hypothetical protein
MMQGTLGGPSIKEVREEAIRRSNPRVGNASLARDGAQRDHAQEAHSLGVG